MRLKFRSLSLLDHQNMPKPIPHCSNFGKIIFLKKGQSNNLSANSYLMSTPNVDLLHWNLSWALTFINLLMRQGVASKDEYLGHHQDVDKTMGLTSDDNCSSIQGIC